MFEVRHVTTPCEQNVKFLNVKMVPILITVLYSVKITLICVYFVLLLLLLLLLLL